MTRPRSSTRSASSGRSSAAGATAVTSRWSSACAIRGARALIVGAASEDLPSEREHVRDWFQVGPDGTVDAEGFARGAGQMVMPMMRQLHPHGEAQVRAIVQWEAAMLLGYPGLTREQLARLDAPTLVVHADRDELIGLESAVELYRALPTAELAILPGATHMRPIFDPATFARVVVDFLQRH